MTEIFHLLALCSDGSRFSGRVGSIMEKFRPPFKLTNDEIGDPPIPISFNIGLFSNRFHVEFHDLKHRIRTAAESVGSIESDSGQVLGTCFRVGSNKKRVVTARHVAAYIIKNGTTLKPGENPSDTELRPTFVVFEANSHKSAERHRISGVELSHGAMDLMLLRLEDDSEREPLNLANIDNERLLAADARHRFGEDSLIRWPVCVIGYPVTKPSASQAQHFEALFMVGSRPLTGIKRASPGFMNNADANRGPELIKPHDATTLPGSSGSPVISARTGDLIGLHVSGGRIWVSGHSDLNDPNGMIYLPSALSDMALKERLDPTSAVTQSTRFPAWPDRNDNKVVGRPITESTTADDFQEAARLMLNTKKSAAPDIHAYSPAVLSDRRDIRDRYYSPPLRETEAALFPYPVRRDSIRRQWLLADCTGCALAVAIERALSKQGRSETVSARMLYEMARLHDEFVDDKPEGTSLRGAIKGLFHNGVCLESEEDQSPDWYLSVARAKEAREFTLGAYYRLKPCLPDFQMAIQETGAVVVAAKTHCGWKTPSEGKIEPEETKIDHSPNEFAAHAFVLIGYDDEGFLIQNSWGPDWGGWRHPYTRKPMPGVAHWTYADWADSVMDAWVLQIAPPAPRAHNLPLRSYLSPTEPRIGILPPEIEALPKPRRLGFIGHIAHVERSGLVEAGRIGVGTRSIRETALHLYSRRSWIDPKHHYTDLVFLFHDPTMGAECAARLSAHLVPRLKAARAYAMNIVYGADEIRSLTARMIDEARFAGELTTGGPDDLTFFLERRAKKVGSTLLDAYLEGVESAAEAGGPLWSILAGFGVESIIPPIGTSKNPRKIHIVAFGVGSLAAHVCFGHDTTASSYGFEKSTLPNPTSVSLLAPVGRPGRQITEAHAWTSRYDKTAPRMLVRKLDSHRPLGTVLDRYRGDWTDLIAAMLSAEKEALRSGDRRKRYPATLAALMTDSKALSYIMKNITGYPTRN